MYCRDDGLNNSQAHIALNDHGSLFHETKEHLEGMFSYSLFLTLFNVIDLVSHSIGIRFSSCMFVVMLFVCV